jgi:hypothetical protein
MVDDVGGVSFDDPLFHADGTPFIVTDVDPTSGLGVARHMTRARLHYDTALSVIRMFGHVDAAGKGVPPAISMVFLGVTMDISAKLLSLLPEKCNTYTACISVLIDGRWDRDTVVAP